MCFNELEVEKNCIYVWKRERKNKQTFDNIFVTREKSSIAKTESLNNTWIGFATLTKLV